MSRPSATLPPVASTSQLQQQGHDQSTSTTPPPPSSSTFHLLPPSLREILDAFAQNGGGDRELLLAILGAKRAEEDRLASSLSLQTQLFLLQSQHQHQQPFHMIPQLQLPLPPRRSQLDDAPPSPSSLSSSSSSSSGPSTPPPSHSSPEMESSIGPIRSAKLSLVRAKLLARKEAKQQQQPQRWSNALSASPPPPPRSPRRSATPRTVEGAVARRSPEATRVALSGLMGVTGSLGVVASSVRPKESWVRGGGSGDEEDQDMEMEEVVRVKLESQE